MDHFTIRSKDIHPHVADALDRLRQERASPSSRLLMSGVHEWLHKLSPTPHVSRSPFVSIENFSSPRPAAKATRKRKLSPSASSSAPGRVRRSARLQQVMASAVPTKAPRTNDSAERPKPNTRANSKNVGQQQQANRAGREIAGGARIHPRLPDNMVLALPDQLEQDPPRSPSRRSPSKSTASGRGGSNVVKKEQLAFFNPPIRFLKHRDLKDQGGLPERTSKLWLDHLSSVVSSDGKIPLMFKVDGLFIAQSARANRVAQNEVAAVFDTPLKSKGPTPDVYEPSPYFHATERGLIWSTVCDVADQAEKYRDRVTESHWVTVVVSPLLQLIRKLRVFHTPDNQSLLEVLDLTAVEISPRTLCPYSGELFKDLDKKIDHAIGLDLSSSERFTLERGQYTEGTTPSINQTATMANMTPLFVNIEVKRRNTDKDPLIQLAAWIAAEFQKRVNEGYGLEQPVLAIEIDGDLWQLYMVYADRMVSGAGYRCNFVGPYGMGSTTTYTGIFKILTVLCRLAQWGVKYHREWFEAQILAKYKSPD